MGDKIKIGIPKTLFYYNYTIFWRTLFTELDFKVVFSDDTNRELLDKGLRASINELCIPIKLLFGHVINLKDRVDYIFLPYYITIEKGSYICPKLIAAPDIIKANFPDVKLLSLDININHFSRSLFSSAKEMVLKLGVNPVELMKAVKKSVEKQKRFERFLTKKYLFSEALKYSEGKKEVRIKNVKNADLTIAVIGHNYVINDPYISSNVIQKLQEKKINILTSDMLSSNEINENIKHLERIPHWTFGNRVLGAALHYSKQPYVTGIIYITPFGCSSDSFIREYLDTHMKQRKPFMTLTVDEHSSDTGLVTRLEAFLDMMLKK